MVLQVFLSNYPVGEQYPCIREKQLNVLVRCTIDLAVSAPAEHGMAWHLTKCCVSSLPVTRGRWQKSQSGGVMLCKGVGHPLPDSEVYCFPREGGIFAKNTNPTVMLTFGSGNFQPEFSVALPFRRDLLQLLIVMLFYHYSAETKIPFEVWSGPEYMHAYMKQGLLPVQFHWGSSPRNQKNAF